MMSNLRVGLTRNALLNRLFKEEFGIDDGAALAAEGSDAIQAALAKKGLKWTPHTTLKAVREMRLKSAQGGAPVEKARRDQTVEELLGLSPTVQRSPAQSASKAAAPGEFDPAKHDPFFKDMCVPIAKAVELPPADSPIYDNAYPGMRVLKEKPAPSDTRKFDWFFVGMKVPLD